MSAILAAAQPAALGRPVAPVERAALVRLARSGFPRGLSGVTEDCPLALLAKALWGAPAVQQAIARHDGSFTGDHAVAEDGGGGGGGACGNAASSALVGSVEAAGSGTVLIREFKADPSWGVPDLEAHILREVQGPDFKWLGARIFNEHGGPELTRGGGDAGNSDAAVSSTVGELLKPGFTLVVVAGGALQLEPRWAERVYGGRARFHVGKDFDQELDDSTQRHGTRPKIQSVRISRCGTVAVVVCRNSHCYVYDLRTGKLRLDMVEQGLLSLEPCISAKHGLIGLQSLFDGYLSVRKFPPAADDISDTVKFLDLETIHCVRSPQHNFVPEDFSPDGLLLACRERRDKIVVVSVRSLMLVGVALPCAESRERMQIKFLSPSTPSPDPRLLAVHGSSHVWVYQVPRVPEAQGAGEPPAQMEVVRKFALNSLSACLSPCGRHVAALAYGGAEVLVHCLETGQRVCKIQLGDLSMLPVTERLIMAPRSQREMSIAVSGPGANLLIVARLGHQARAWDLTTGRALSRSEDGGQRLASRRNYPESLTEAIVARGWRSDMKVAALPNARFIVGVSASQECTLLPLVE